MTSTADYVRLSVSDRDGRVAMHATMSDTLPEGTLSKLGGMLVGELRSGVISPDVAADPDRSGEALIVLEEDGEGEIDMSIVFEPTITPADAELSGTQALALSALQRVQHKLGLDAVTLDRVICD